MNNFKQNWENTQCLNIKKSLTLENEKWGISKQDFINWFIYRLNVVFFLLLKCERNITGKCCHDLLQNLSSKKRRMNEGIYWSQVVNAQAQKPVYFPNEQALISQAMEKSHRFSYAEVISISHQSTLTVFSVLCDIYHYILMLKGVKWILGIWRAHSSPNS